MKVIKNYFFRGWGVGVGFRNLRFLENGPSDEAGERLSLADVCRRHIGVFTLKFQGQCGAIRCTALKNWAVTQKRHTVE